MTACNNLESGPQSTTALSLTNVEFTYCSLEREARQDLEETTDSS